MKNSKTQTSVHFSFIVSLMVLMFTTSIIHSQNIFTFDKNHSRLSFSVMHFGISNVEGNFKNFEATLKSNKADLTDALIEMTADVKSIDTDVEMRDKDLKGAGWFDAEKYPTFTFKSTSFKKTGNKNYKLEGDITMHGITKLIVFDVIYNGQAQNPMSKKYMVGFTVTGKLNRKDFNVGTAPSAGVVGDEIGLSSNVEFTTDQPSATGTIK
jgi:polyisoprenoid-binding protein YceI